MYAEIDKQTMKALNRVDKRRKMKYRGWHAEELRFQREEVEGPEGRDEGQRPRAHYGHPAYNR